MNSILRKPLLFGVMFNVSAFATAADNESLFETFGKSIDSAMNKYFSMETIFLLIACAMLLIFAVVLYETYRSRKVKRELWTLAMARFDVQAEKLNLRLSSVAILKRIVQKSGLDDPASIMKFSHVFENSLDKYYISEKIESIANEILVQIGVLRKELGFSPLPRGISLTSTRQFCSGDKCIIRIPDNDPPIPAETCYVYDSDERHWSVTRPEWSQVPKGTWVQMSLTKPGDAEYAFRTQVLEDLKGEIFLSHTNRLVRTQQRNWLRVDADIPVMATQLDEAHIGEVLSGKIVDISGGGLGMLLSTRLQKNTVLILNFEIPGRGKITDLLVRVIRVAGPPEGISSKVVHSVSFESETDLAREKIIQYVFEIQRESLAARQSD